MHHTEADGGEVLVNWPLFFFGKEIKKKYNGLIVRGGIGSSSTQFCN
jgi:hypothetical protein